MVGKESAISTILNQFHQLKPLLAHLRSSQSASKEEILTCQPSLQCRSGHITTSSQIIDANMRIGRRVYTHPTTELPDKHK